MSNLLGALAQVAGAAGAGTAKGKFERQELDKEEMREALAQEARKRQEGRADRQLDLENQRLTSADADRKESRAVRLQQMAAVDEQREADRKERAREADQRVRTPKAPAALNPDVRRQQFIDHRRTELMKPHKLGEKGQQLDAAGAQRQAMSEADEVFGPAAGAPAVKPAKAPGGDVALGGNTAAIANLRASAARAIANGADPAKVNARLAQKLQELGGQ